MRITSVKEFRDRATDMFRSEEPVLVTRRGRPAGLFVPLDGDTLPLDLKRELSASIAKLVRDRLDRKGVKEQDVLDDFETFRRRR